MQQSDELDRIITQSRFPWWRLILGCLALAAIALGLFFGIRALVTDQNDEATISQTEEIATQRGPFTTTMAVSGVAAAATSSQLAFPLSGQIAEVLVEIGDLVSRGQVLARLDARDASTQVLTAEVNLAQANLVLQQMNEPTRNTTLTSAKQSTAAARAQLKSAELSLENLTDPATASELASAAKSVAQATSTLAKLQTPPNTAQITAADAAVIKSESNLNSSVRQIDTSLANLRNAHGVYCDWFTEARRPVDLCWKTAVPLSADKIISLSESIAMPINPPARIFELTIALLQADTTYKNALDIKINSQSALETARAERTALSEAPHQHELDQTIASLESATANQDALANEPTSMQLAQAIAAVVSAEAALTSALAKESELAAGPWPLDIKLQEQAILLAEIAVTKAQNGLKDLELTAPFDGIIGTISGTIGDRVSPSMPILVLHDPTSIQVNLTISETDLGTLEPGQLAIGQFDAIPGQVYVLQISNISSVPTVTQGIVTYPVHAKILRGNELAENRSQLNQIISTIGSSMGFTNLPVQDSTGASTRQGVRQTDSREAMLGCVQRVLGRMPTSLSDVTADEQEKVRQECFDRETGSDTATRSMEPAFDQDIPAIGMNANVIVAIEIRPDVLYIPSKAIHRIGRNSYVFVASDQGGPEERLVVIGETDGTRTEITEGLSEGDIVIVTTPASSTSAASTNGSTVPFRQIQ